jgi:phosphoribosylamine-glycine ligase
MMQVYCEQEAAGQLVKCPTLATAGDYVLTMTALAETVQDARTKVYRRLDRVRKRMPGSPMYRTDIGLRLSKQLPQLQALGYAKGLQFSTPPTS